MILGSSEIAITEYTVKITAIGLFQLSLVPQLQLESISTRVYVPCLGDTLLTSIGIFGDKQGDN